MVLGLSKKKILGIRIVGDPVLAKKAKSVTQLDHDMLRFGQELVDAMFEFDGVGLAAPQVGVSIRMIALGVPQPKSRDCEITGGFSPGELQLLPLMPIVLVNPEIIRHGSILETREEGCLSVPEIYANVKRPASATVRGQLLGGGIIEAECGGLLARALQHEIDHLDGILFVDRLEKEEIEKIKPQLDRLKKNAKRKGYLRTTD